MKTQTSILLASVALLITCFTVNGRTISKFEPIKISTPEGTAPRLPWQIYVTYSDGCSEWRQVKWDNSARQTEEDQSSRRAGDSYYVSGHILGDSSNPQGYPVTAQVSVNQVKWEVPDLPKASTLPLCDVQLIGDNRLTSNRDLDIRHLLELDVRQQLFNYRDTYGLSTEGYPESDGWDSPTTKLKGHGSGHYMSALAFAFASSTDKQQRDRLRENIRIMVDQLRECQERTFVWDESLGRYREARDLAPEEELRELKGDWEAFEEYKKDWTRYGYGYLNAIPAQHPVLVEMYRPYNNNNWVWAPYYSIHKQLAGLIDIACNIDDEKLADKALLIAKDMGLWVWNRLHYRTFVKSDGTQEERRQKPGNRHEMWNMYIAGEVGGMSESLSRLSEMVSSPEESAKLIEAANFFDAPAFFKPLSANIDDIRGRHANQHIPMITGALRSYAVNRDPYYYNIACNFWNLLQGRYIYATGGVGNAEMFREPYTQIASMNANDTPTLNETCCAYNLAKLTKDLNCYDPDNAGYMDYYERVLYNQIVGSVHPTHYGTTYHYAVGMNARKPFGNRTPQSSCCGGTGSENHVKYQEAAYFVSDDTIWVSLYLPTVARWKSKGITLEQECLWPAERSTITVKEGKARFSMKLRVPYWATSGFEVRLNGRLVSRGCRPSSYIVINSRKWKPSDKVEIIMPFGKHINFGPDKMATADGDAWVGALMYGPLVMATSEVRSWEEADFRIDSDLDGIKLLGASPAGGVDGNLYKLTMGGKTFQPDYWHTGNETHYLRLYVR